MSVVSVPSVSRQAATPNGFPHSAPQEKFSDARYKVRFVQNAAEFDAVVGRRIGSVVFDATRSR